MGKLQVQPELASGISSSPPAGIILIQQPGRVTSVTLLSFPVAKSHMVGFPARKKQAAADAEMVPQPCPPRVIFQLARRVPVARWYAKGST